MIYSKTIFQRIFTGMLRKQNNNGEKKNTKISNKTNKKLRRNRRRHPISLPVYFIIFFSDQQK